MLVVFAALALVAVFVIAAVAIGRESSRLTSQSPRPVFDLDEAVATVADGLPFEVSAVLSHEDVRQILGWSLERLQVPEAPAKVNGRGPGADLTDLVVVSGAETAEFVLERVGAAGLDCTPDQVQAVLDAQLAYLQSIGAVGPTEPDELAPD